MYSRLRGVLAAGMLIGWLACPVVADPGPAGPLPRQIVVQLSEGLFAPLIERPIDELHPVDEEILGVRAVGQARVVGQPVVEMVDDPQRASFQVTITGTVATQTVGRKGPVEMHSSSTTEFTATKRVSFQPGRGFVGEPAAIEAKTSTQTDRIEPDRRGILGRAIARRAWRRVGESRAEVNQIVQARADVKIRQAFDRLLEARLARLNRRVDQRYLIAALLGGDQPPHYQCCTWDGALVIAASAEAPQDSGSPGERLATSIPQSPVQVWFHDEVVDQRLAAVLRGIDLARRTWEQLTLLNADARVPALPNRPRRMYDFAVVGNWIVVRADGPTPSSPMHQDAATPVGLTASGTSPESAGGQ